MIKLVSFDLDGTIGDTLELGIRTFKITVEPYLGRGLSQEEILGYYGLSIDGMLREVVGEKWEDALREFSLNYERLHYLSPKPFDGIKEVIEELRSRGVIVTLITGRERKGCDMTLQIYGLLESFDMITTGSATIRNNKSVQIKEQLMEYNLQPHEMIYIGDDISDVMACRDAGVRCLSAAYSTTKSNIEKLKSENPDNIFYTVESLIKYIKSITIN